MKKIFISIFATISLLFLGTIHADEYKLTLNPNFEESFINCIWNSEANKATCSLDEDTQKVFTTVMACPGGTTQEISEPEEGYIGTFSTKSGKKCLIYPAKKFAEFVGKENAQLPSATM